MTSPTTYTPNIILSSSRILLSTYLFMLGTVVALSLPPLPEEPARINFYGLLIVCGVLVATIHLLKSQNRWVPILLAAGLPMTAWYMVKRVKLLQMILEPYQLEQVVLFTLPFVLIYLVSPPIWHEFNQITSNQRQADKAGFPF